MRWPMYLTMGLNYILREERNFTVVCMLYDWVHSAFSKRMKSIFYCIRVFSEVANHWKLRIGRRSTKITSYLLRNKVFFFLVFKTVALRSISHTKIFCFMFRSYSWKGASSFGYSLPEGCIDFLLKLFKFHKEYWYGKGCNDKPLQQFPTLFYLSLNILQKVRQSQKPSERCSLYCKKGNCPSQL